MLFLTLAGLAAADPMMRDCDTNDEKFLAAYNAAVDAYNAHDSKAAAKAATRAVDLQPSCVGALQLLGSTLLLQSDPRAIAVAEKGARLHPDLAIFPTLECRARFAAQDFEGALAAARRGRRADPADIDALDAEVAAYLRLGRYDEALASLDAATGVPAGDIACERILIYVDQDRLAEAEALVDACSTAPDATRAFAMASLASRRGDHRGALAETAKYTDDVGPVLAAHDAFEAGRYADALAMYRQLLAAEPQNSALRINLATCLYLTGDRKHARKELESLFSADSWVTVHSTGAFTGIITYRSEQELDAAIQRALSRLVVLLVDEGELDDARTAQRKAEVRYGRTPDIIASDLWLTRATGGPDAAWALVSQALGSWPENARMLNMVGRLAYAEPAGLHEVATEALLAHGTAGDLTNALAGLGNARRFPACAAFAVRALPRLEGDDRAETRSRGYQCAANAEDLVNLEALRGGTSEGLPPWAVARHAALLLEAGRVEDAVALARGVMETEEGAVAAIQVLVTAEAGAGRIPDAIQLANHPRAGAITRMNLGVDLYNGKRYAEAREATRLLDCGGVRAEDRANCTGLLEAVLAAAP